MKRGYLICPNAEGEHSLLADIHGHPSLFDAPSVAFLSIRKDDGVTNKPDNPRYYPVNLQGAQSPLHRLGKSQQAAVASVYQTRTVIGLQRP